MRNVTIFAVTILLGSACGNNNNNNNVNLTKMDLSVGTQPDMTASTTSQYAGHACGSIDNCINDPNTKDPKTCTKGAPPASVTNLMAFYKCISDSCGQQMDGNGLPCSNPATTDAGASMCLTCVDNTLGGPMSFFADSKGNQLMCMPTTAPNCGMCLGPAMTCLFECYGDADCSSLTHSDGSMATCMGNVGDTPGQCM